MTFCRRVSNTSTQPLFVIRLYSFVGFFLILFSSWQAPLYQVEPMSAEALLEAYKEKRADEGRLFMDEFQVTLSYFHLNPQACRRSISAASVKVNSKT